MKYIVTLELETTSDFSIDEATDLINEQWDQTASAMEGDVIQVIKVVKGI